MATVEKLDPLPDTFILQPPVFHPVSSHSDWEPPRSQGISLPAGSRSQGWDGEALSLGPGFPSICPPAPERPS